MMIGPAALTMDEQAAMQAVQDALPSASARQSPDRCTLLFDCRDVPEPQSREAQFHTGLHPKFFKDFAASPKVGKLIDQVQLLLSQCYTKEQTHITCVFLDVHGRFGALACGKAIAECLLSEPAVSLARVTCIGNDRDWSCQNRVRCLFWDRKWRYKNIAVLDIVGQWKKAKLDNKIK